MKTTVSVVVLQPFEWKGQHYAPGQSAILTPIDAVVLTKKHVVTLTRRKAVAPTPEPPPPPTPEPVVDPPKSRRGYRRRDLQAEETTEIAPLPPVEDETPPAPVDPEF